MPIRATSWLIYCCHVYANCRGIKTMALVLITVDLRFPKKLGRFRLVVLIIFTKRREEYKFKSCLNTE